MKVNKKVGNYHIYYDQPIGKGATSEVMRGVRISDGKMVAVKIIEKMQFANKQQDEKEQMYKSIQREISIHKNLDHQNFIKLYDYLESPNSIYMFLELAECTIDEYVKQSQPSEEQLKSIMKQIIQAFVYLSQLYLKNQYQNNKLYKGICHLDVKPQNILMIDHKVKITDFGLSIPLNVDECQSKIQTEDDFFRTKQFYLCKGTLKYMSPQQLESVEIQKLELHDVWSAGVIFYEFIYHKHPFFVNTINSHQLNGVQINPITVSQMLKQNKIEFPKLDKISNSQIDLLKRMLSIDPKTRFTWEQCLNHPYFNS